MIVALVFAYRMMVVGIAAPDVIVELAVVAVVYLGICIDLSHLVGNQNDPSTRLLLQLVEVYSAA